MQRVWIWGYVQIVVEDWYLFVLMTLNVVRILIPVILAVIRVCILVVFIILGWK